MTSKKIVEPLYRSKTKRTIVEDSTLQLSLGEEKQAPPLLDLADERLAKKIDKLKNTSKKPV